MHDIALTLLVSTITIGLVGVIMAALHATLKDY